MNEHDTAVSPAVASLIDLFQAQLPDVQFPDVDTQVLVASADAVRAAALEVAQAEEALLQARRTLGGHQELLLQKAQRALAYARIYAEENSELLALLDAVQLPRGPRKATAAAPNGESNEAPRKRGRPRKVMEPVETLFGEASAA